ncbi:MAG: DUF3144 domain-containing protein [Pseudomonadota bacterium]
MSDNPLDQQFFDIADAFIRVANEHSRTVAHGKVSAAMAYAAARFNAFVLASARETPEALRGDEARALDYFSGQYRSMLKEHLADYAKNYDRYLKK